MAMWNLVLKRIVSLCIVLGFISCSNPADDLAKAKSAYNDQNWQEVINHLKDFPNDHGLKDEAMFMAVKAHCMMDNYAEAFSVFQKIDSSSTYFGSSLKFIKTSGTNLNDQSRYSKAIDALNSIPATSIHYKNAHQELILAIDETKKREKFEQQRRSALLLQVAKSLSITNCSVYTVPIEDPSIYQQIRGYKYYVYANFTINNASECDIKDFNIRFQLFGESGTYLREEFTSDTIYKVVRAGRSVTEAHVKIGSTAVKNVDANCEINNYRHMCF